MTTGEVVSLVLGAVAIAQGFFAVWLSVHFKAEADRVNERTTDLLVEVKTDAKALMTISAGELQRWGEAGRRAILGNTVQGDPSANVTIGGLSEQTNVPAQPEGGPDAIHR